MLRLGLWCKLKPIDLQSVFDHTYGDNSTEITPNSLQLMVYSGAYVSGTFIDNEIMGATIAFPVTNG